MQLAQCLVDHSQAFLGTSDAGLRDATGPWKEFTGLLHGSS